MKISSSHSQDDTCEKMKKRSLAKNIKTQAFDRLNCSLQRVK